MKIIIIGGGVGGLAAYHAIRKYLPDVSVQLYEAYPSPTGAATIIGGGLGLAPNGQRVLAKLSPDAISHIQKHSFCASAFVFRDQAGRKLAEKRWNPQKVEFSQVLAARAVVHDGLLLGLEETPNLVWGKAVTSIEETEEQVQVTFADGETQQCDLVIAADGVHSLARKAVFGKDSYEPKYDGLTGIGGFLPLSSFSASVREGIKKEGVTMTFSRSGFFGCTLVLPLTTSDTRQQIQWWSTFEVDPPLSRDTLPKDVREQLLKRHGDWKSPFDPPKAEGEGLFAQIINNACASKSDGTLYDRGRWLVLPRYNIEPLTTYTSYDSKTRKKGRIILIGDAAHPVPPDSGQGVSIAAEDALALALLLQRYLAAKKKDVYAIQATAIAFDAIRVPRVAKILAMSKQSGDKKKDIGFLGEKIRNLMLWLFCHMPQSFDNMFFGHKVDEQVKKYLEKHKG